MAEQRDDQDRPDPTPEHLELTATPARLRRAPRYRAFATTGAVLLAVIGAVAVLTTGPSAGRGAPLVVVVLGAVVLGALLGGLVAVLLDRR